ncbi:MAG TPA: MoaD/ThiS family protein [Flavisolibacter sp.]|jgi:molybdopterin synthase sulfur carrier subunit|nr:MoaD/ThiS family protein [Flavisolibacter sp.]
MRVNVLAFGIAKEIFGANHFVIEFDGSNVEGLKMSLEQQFPLLKQLSHYMFAVNREYATDQTQVNTGDEVAIIPPVSGG